MINNPSKIIRKGQKPFFGQITKEPYKFLKMGLLVDIDYENGITSIQWIDAPGGNIEIPISLPYGGPRSHISVMPEEGSIVLCGFTKQTQTSGSPVILQYLTSGYTDSLDYLLNRGYFNVDDKRTEIQEKELSNTALKELIENKVSKNILRYKKTKIYPGEIQLESRQGSELYLDENILLSNSNLNEIHLRSADQHIIFNSINNSIITSGGRIKNGIITRNLSSEYFAIQDNNTDISKNAPFKKPIYLSNGKVLFIVTSDERSIDAIDPAITQSGGGAFTELRTEISETFDMRTRVVEENSEMDLDAPEKNPFITHVMGTIVGNIPTDTRTYGRVLRPQVFSSPDSTALALDDVPVVESPELYKVLAGAYQLKFRNYGRTSDNVGTTFNNRTCFTIDKEGHLFINISASRSHPFGAGRSIECNTEGSIKLVVGANKQRGDSINLDTLGRIVINLNKDNTYDESLNMTTIGGIKLNIGKDKEKNSVNIITSGNWQETIKGNKKLIVEGNYSIESNGVIEEKIRGTKIETYVNDKHTAYGGNYSLAIHGKTNETISDGKFTSIVGNLINSSEVVNKTHITQGADELYILRGNSNISIINGNITRSVQIGNYENNISIGNYKINVTSGNIEIKSSIGSIILSGSNDVSIKGALNINIESSVAVNLKTTMCTLDTTSLFIGKNATQPLVKGFELLSWLASHIHGSGTGPTTPPLAPPTPSMLSVGAFVK